MTAQPDLAALLGARICHDLISPLGAIGNGVELLLLDGKPLSPELALIAESVAAANARIRFLRVATGPDGAGQLMGAPEVANLLDDALRGGRITVDWPRSTHSRPEVRRAFRALMCLYGVLPAGGRISVAVDSGVWHFDAAGPGLRPDAGPWQLVTDPAPGEVALTPAQVQFGLLRADLLDGPGLALLERGPGALRLSYPAHPA